MNPLLLSLANHAETLNGAATNASSLNKVVDLFFQIGAMRSWEDNKIIESFTAAFEQNPEQAIKVLFWARDIRGGAGERNVFRVICRHLAANYPANFAHLVKAIPEYGRWDDLLLFVEEEEQNPCRIAALDVIANALRSNDALCAKWMPREKSSKRAIASVIRKHMGLSQKEYRKMLSSLTSVVETQMCNKDWDKINYSAVPSQAMNIYKQAFSRNSPDTWAAYMEGLLDGTEKVNASAIYPYQILRPMLDLCLSFCGGRTQYTLEEVVSHLPEKTRNNLADLINITNHQWDSMPNWIMNNPYRILPVVDTSGSMYSGFTSGLRPIDASVSLGLYIAERNNGPFQDHFITFSENPDIQKITGENIFERTLNLASAEWGYNTNLEKVFDIVLTHAKRGNIPEDDMPNVILILSDMEFDAGITAPNDTLMGTIKSKYQESGYEVPKIVFWNLNAREGNVPVTYREDGTALVSGFSPSIMTALLAGDNFTPEGIMLAAIGSERYNQISS